MISKRYANGIATTMTRRKTRHKDLPFSPSQAQLLDNVLDALDRLYDNESTVADVQAILFATSVAMEGSEVQELLSSTAEKLQRLIRCTVFPGSDTIRQQALIVTDAFRQQMPA